MIRLEEVTNRLKRGSLRSTKRSMRILRSWPRSKRRSSKMRNCRFKMPRETSTSRSRAR